MVSGQGSTNAMPNLIGITSTLCPNSKIWVNFMAIFKDENEAFVVGAPRFLTGAEHMMLQGFGLSVIRQAQSSDVSDNTLCDMAGNAWSSLIACAGTLSILKHTTPAMLAEIKRCIAALHAAPEPEVRETVFIVLNFLDASRCPE